MVYDCFTFFNELDLLEIRINTLKDVVDRFVIAEATRTHTGKPKDLNYAKNRHRFLAFADKIEYVVVDDLLSEDEVSKDIYNFPWVNENRQRNALMRGLQGAHYNDIVMVSDLDEIPRPQAVLRAKSNIEKGTDSIRFELRSYNFYLNFANFTCPKWLMGTVAAKYGDLVGGKLLAAVIYDRYTQKSENQGIALHKLRFVKSKTVIGDAGWHFSFLGGIDAIQKKLAAFSHSEFGSVPRELLEERLRKGCDLFGRNGSFFGVPINSSFPDFVVGNQSRFSNYLFPVDEKYLRRTRFARIAARTRGVIYRLLVKMVPNCLAPVIVRTRDAVMKKLGRI